MLEKSDVIKELEEKIKIQKRKEKIKQEKELNKAMSSILKELNTNNLMKKDFKDFLEKHNLNETYIELSKTFNITPKEENIEQQIGTNYITPSQN